MNTRNWAFGRRATGGFSLVELMFVLGLGAVLAGTAVPAIEGARQRMELSGATHDVAAAMQSARLRAVSTGRTMRVRFNCPSAGQFRVVEVTGNSTIDNATNRCDPEAFPYPDADASARPNTDGPVQTLRGGVTFNAVTNLDITPTGRVTPATGVAPVSIVVSRGNGTQTLTMSASGRVAFQ